MRIDIIIEMAPAMLPPEIATWPVIIDSEKTTKHKHKNSYTVCEFAKTRKGEI